MHEFIYITDRVMGREYALQLLIRCILCHPIYELITYKKHIRAINLYAKFKKLQIICISMGIYHLYRRVFQMHNKWYVHKCMLNIMFKYTEFFLSYLDDIYGDFIEKIGYHSNVCENDFISKLLSYDMLLQDNKYISSIPLATKISSKFVNSISYCRQKYYDAVMTCIFSNKYGDKFGNISLNHLNIASDDGMKKIKYFVQEMVVLAGLFVLILSLIIIEILLFDNFLKFSPQEFLPQKLPSHGYFQMLSYVIMIILSLSFLCGHLYGRKYVSFFKITFFLEFVCYEMHYILCYGYNGVNVYWFMICGLIIIIASLVQYTYELYTFIRKKRQMFRLIHHVDIEQLFEYDEIVLGNSHYFYKFINHLQKNNVKKPTDKILNDVNLSYDINSNIHVLLNCMICCDMDADKKFLFRRMILESVMHEYKKQRCSSYHLNSAKCWDEIQNVSEKLEKFKLCSHVHAYRRFFGILLMGLCMYLRILWFNYGWSFLFLIVASLIVLKLWNFYKFYISGIRRLDDLMKHI